MKVIFLDITGVISLWSQWGGRFVSISKYKTSCRGSYIASVPVDIRNDKFDGKSVKILNEILFNTDAEIVVTSSDWKSSNTIEELVELFELRKIKKVPIFVTPTILDSSLSIEEIRIKEIELYLSEHSEVSEWVILDHLDLRSLSERAVWCSSNIEGIKMDGKQQLIVKMLGCRYVSKEAVKKKEHKAVIKENKLERSKEFKKNAKAKKSIERAAKLKEKQKKDMFLEDRLY